MLHHGQTPTRELRKEVNNQPATTVAKEALQILKLICDQYPGISLEALVEVVYAVDRAVADARHARTYEEFVRAVLPAFKRRRFHGHHFADAFIVNGEVRAILVGPTLPDNDFDPARSNQLTFAVPQEMFPFAF